ncbi:Opacity protein antigens [Legionella massiliensis]|uniref:Opacity protein antigens n=1 Tax=Legionella massiliensis TaxID=1034943 RepID=A0A078KYY3_9GAMM|nr:outer membrane beta-barrel protein [Legionella massiliensis]CDZ78151.1 Opacity protein antigens [Legionella massiliensis]CEE13889.1 hypothetical protein BN1094_02458 [Legionella massiliensis]
MKTKQIYIASLVTLASSSLFAGTMGPVATPSSWSPVATLSLGPAWYNNNKSQTVAFDEGISKRFTGGNSDKAVFSGEIFLGMQGTLIDQLIGEFGVAFAANSKMDFSGRVWDFDDSQFSNYKYRYNVQHARIGLKGKLIGDLGYMVQPYVSASIDAGFNRAKHFTLTTLIPEAVAFPGFQSNSTTTVAYTLGAGIQRALTTHWRAGVGYEFASLGTSKLGIAPGQAVGSGLKSKNLYTNELQFSISYVA